MADINFARPPAWTERALCPEVDTEVFFAEDTGATAAARRICALCPVRAECLDYALEHNIVEGVWGGLSWYGRRAIRRAA